VSEEPIAPVAPLDRRAVLTWIGLVAAATGGVRYLEGDAAQPAGGSGYGLDPRLTDPKAYWARTLDPGQLAVIRQLCDFVLPAEGPAPAASALHIDEFIDEWVSAPYPDQAADRILILEGLAWLDRDARRRINAATFLGAPTAVRAAILNDLADARSSGAMAPSGFFAKVRKLVIGAYYTTEAGFADIGFSGNVALKSWPGPSPEVVAAINLALGKLGLA
jgi:hypothetical protein